MRVHDIPELHDRIIVVTARFYEAGILTKDHVIREAEADRVGTLKDLAEHVVGAWRCRARNKGPMREKKRKLQVVMTREDVNICPAPGCAGE